jgi:DNA-binding NarL/FixJ family response regulator
MPAIRIAICDDHPLFRAGIISVLATQPDLSVSVEADSVPELLEKLARTQVDVVLLDLALPEGNSLRALPALVRVSQVLVFSAFDDPARVKEAMELGAMGWVVKDVDPLELFRCIREVASGRTVLSGDLASQVAHSLRREADESDLRRKIESLTPRQRQVLSLLREGKTAREISGLLFVSEGTAKNHVTRVLQVLEVDDRARLVHMLMRYRIGV